MIPTPLFSFECYPAGQPEWATRLNASTRGQAKALYHSDLSDSWPSIPFTAIRCRKLGPPESSAGFLQTAAYRGHPDARCGDRVKVSGTLGTLVGVGTGALFKVHFDADAPRYAGQQLLCHPDEMVFLPK